MVSISATKRDNFAILALFDFFYLPTIVSSMSSQGFEGAFDFFYLPIVINLEKTLVLMYY